MTKPPYKPLVIAIVCLAALGACASPSGSDSDAESRSDGKPAGAAATCSDVINELPDVPAFEVTSTDVADGEPLPTPQLSARFGIDGGQDESPQLSWSGFPPETESFIVSMYDPDAPTGSGFWHWTAIDIPAEVSSLDGGAAIALPAGGRAIRNDAGSTDFVGAAPPPGDGEHRYVVTVTAVDVPRLDVPDDASPALVGFTAGARTVGRATLTATAEIGG